MNITGMTLSNAELLTLVNESSMGIVIESSGKIVAANDFFFEISNLSFEDLTDNSIDEYLSDDSKRLVGEYRNRILNSIEKSQIVRTEDTRFAVTLVRKDGRKVGCLLLMVCLSAEKPKWVYKLIEQSLFHAEKERIVKMENLKDHLLTLSQSLIRMKDIQNFYSMVLEAAGSTISQGEYCTILQLVDEKYFIPVAARGYSWDVMEEFRLPLEKSFSWLTLGKLLDQTLIVDDIDELCNNVENMVEVRGYPIKSSLQTPIFLNEKLYGILTIDSSRKNVFTVDDFNTIEYLRAQIQIALENQLLYNQIRHKASHDELTDVASRGAFEEQVIKFLRTKHHYESCCIIMMDLNDLKVVNDVWGHSAGDKYLLEFISVMQQHMRGSDLLARLGGDEFAICFFSSQSAQFIERIIDIQRYFISNPLIFKKEKVSCYFSYGISYCPEDGETYDVLMNKADSRMYKMKAELKSLKLENDLHKYRK